MKSKKTDAFGRIKNGSANRLYIATDFNDIQPGQLLTPEMILEKFDINNAGQFSIKASILARVMQIYIIVEFTCTKNIFVLIKCIRRKK